MTNLSNRPEVNFDKMKMEEAVHFICSTCKPDDRLGAVKLNKILYYSDMTSYMETGKAITGATYAKRPKGPVPKQVTAAIDELKRAGRLETREVSIFDHFRREFTAKGSTDVSIFQPEELARISGMITNLCKFNANDVSELSHTIVWEVADMGEELPYNSFFASYLGDVDDADRDVVRDALGRAEAAGRVYA